MEIHAVDWEACGLGDYGKPTGYLDRQLRRFGGLWEHNKTRELPVLDELTAWLAEHKPESGPATIVHGDYRLGNVMFAPGDAAAAERDLRLGAGHDRRPARRRRLPDRHLGAARRPARARSRRSAGSRASPASSRRDELIARYEERSGRSMRDVRWYMTLALWKSAVFLEGSYKRRLAGTTEDAFFDLLEAGRARGRRPRVADRAGVE